MAYTDIISLTTAKNHLRVDDTADDTAITRMIGSALSYLERTTNIIAYQRNETYKLTDGYVRIYDYPINSVISPVTNVYATATAQCTIVLAGDTITINGLTYTAVSGSVSDYTEFSVDGSDTLCAASLAKAVNGDTRTGTVGNVTATSSGDTVTLKTDKEGFDGNATTIAQTGGTITLSGSTFSGGFDGVMTNVEEYTNYTKYIYGSDTVDLTLDVGYATVSDYPDELIEVALEIIDLMYYEHETGKSFTKDLSQQSVNIINSYRRFIL